MKLQDGDVFKIVSKDTELMCPQEPCGAPIFVASAANFIFGKYNTHAAAYATNARFVAFLGTFARPAQEVWLPGNDLKDPTTWSVPPLCTLKHLHAALLQDYDCTEQTAADLPAQPSGAGGSAAATAGTPPPPPPARSQDTGSGTLVLPQLNRSRAPLLLPLLLSHNIPLPQVH
jgi:hypothetical protein